MKATRMKNNPGLLLVVAVLVGMGLQAVSAAESHGTHVHGQAELTIVRYEETLYIELESPAMNMVGFESGPLSERQTGLLQEAVTALESSDTTLSVAGAACRTANIQARTRGFEEGDDHDHGGHADFTVAMQLQCDTDNVPLTITVKLFEHFASLESVDVMWVSNNRQGAKTLTRNRRTLQLE